MELFIAFSLTTFSGVVVSLVTLWLASRQRSKQEALAEARRREAILAAMGSELRWNRTATRGSLDATNAHVMVGALASVAFERHGADLSTIAPESVELVFKHYALVGRAREGIRAMAGPPGANAGESIRSQWIEICREASVEVTNSATVALQNLGLPILEHELG